MQRMIRGKTLRTKNKTSKQITWMIQTTSDTTNLEQWDSLKQKRTNRECNKEVGIRTIMIIMMTQITSDSTSQEQ